MPPSVALAPDAGPPANHLFPVFLKLENLRVLLVCVGLTVILWSLWALRKLL